VGVLVLAEPGYSRSIAADNVQELRNRTLVGLLQPHRSYQTAAVPCRRKGDHEQNGGFKRFG
jgi:hypothetical protein